MILAHPTANIYFTGHSLGAVLTLYAALDVKQFAPSTPMAIYTFGQPRSGNVEFANYAMTVFPNGTYQRVTHLTDIVPHSPSNKPYMHAGNEAWYFSPIPGDMSYFECENEAFQPENKNCSLSMNWAISIDDHKNYMALPISNFCDAYEPTNPKAIDEI